ncbi:MAG: rhomboid family intramembrane serine protease [Vicinamibacterales bacterium]
MALRRQRTGSVVCPSCGTLVGVSDERCYNCGRWNPGLWGFTPMLRRFGHDMGFVPFVIGGCSVIYLVTLLISGPNMRMSGLFSLLSPDGTILFLFGASGSMPVFAAGRWWTVLSASWLHGGLLHILFNMLWVRQLAPATADLFGPGRMIIIYTAAGACGFLLSSVAGYLLPGVPILGGARMTVGASAAVFGLLGALVAYGRRGSGLISREAMGYAMMLFVFGLVMPGVDNYGHAGGFAGGYLLGRWLDPLRPERVEHVLAGIIALLASFLAILASILDGMRI